MSQRKPQPRRGQKAGGCTGDRKRPHCRTRLAKEKGIPVKVVTESKLSQLTGGAVHQGVAAEGACGTYVSLEELLERAAEKGEPPLLVLCDGIQDPHNLGAIIRTAEAAGAHGVVIPKRRSASLTLTVGKTSAGAASWLPVARVPNLASAMETLKKNGVWIYGTDAAGTSYTDADFTGGTAFVIGSEGFGMSRLVSEKVRRYAQSAHAWKGQLPECVRGGRHFYVRSSSPAAGEVTFLPQE